MDLRALTERLNGSLGGLMAEVKEYFSDLNEREKYAWVGEGIGFVLFLSGIVLLVL